MTTRSNELSACGSCDTPDYARRSLPDQDAVLTPDAASLSNTGSISGPIAISPNTPSSYQQLHEISPSQHVGAQFPAPTCHPDLSRSDAVYLHHFAQHLAVWLDCTDASRRFALNVTTLARASPILLNAVVSFAARHMRCGMAADSAQQKCLELLIPHLSCDQVGRDEAILCAIVILRVCEQLSGNKCCRRYSTNRILLTSPTATLTGGDQERHLSGLSALMKASQAHFELDPSSPTLSQAAFWVFVRQVLYNACVNQQSPNLDFNLIVLPPPSADASLIGIETETAWSNTMTWICAQVIRFCFGDTVSPPRTDTYEQRWLEMSRAVKDWQDSKPSTFEPIWYSEPEPDGDNPFPEILFTSDWHGKHKHCKTDRSSADCIPSVMAFGFYHLACMLLEIYQAAPRFAIRRVLVGTKNTDV